MRTADDHGRAGAPPVTGPADRLRRSAARWEDLLSVGLGLLLAIGLVVAWLAGSAASGAVAERGMAEASERTETEAVVTERATPIGEMQAGMQAVTVAWTASDGTERTGPSSTAGLHEVGDRVTVWVDRNGALTSPPATAEDAATVGFGAGFMTVVLWGVLVVGAGFLAFRWTAGRFARAWELDWAAVEPQWTGRRTG
ncbi:MULTISPECIES: Rv1733c family protein [Pseudonocardia]|uniref:Integral membrane protein n=2 Tax=Pseudonocardia TaxID=1847 RepID=A0A1Y2N744_PSEAH|nr:MULTISPECIES: hypothetical protein [Pseudonocardia]OSY43296.1 hypothetical protein BG845_00901 [Pseudonocardia autotrophica]TDN71784.1 hypothetical protein C8E95_0818 [Pseudonocardia autotrophica]BBG02472.1 hypothetical protein Pdca_36810 [Pseudonocardia autotrophica]GEC26948.1 hypothetical protein PSA01_39770 [Pseudonocardia saturnea]